MKVEIALIKVWTGTTRRGVADGKLDQLLGAGASSVKTKKELRTWIEDSLNSMLWNGPTEGLVEIRVLFPDEGIQVSAFTGAGTADESIPVSKLQYLCEAVYGGY